MNGTAPVGSGMEEAAAMKQVLHILFSHHLLRREKQYVHVQKSLYIVCINSKMCAGNRMYSESRKSYYKMAKTLSYLLVDCPFLAN